MPGNPKFGTRLWLVPAVLSAVVALGWLGRNVVSGLNAADAAEKEGIRRSIERIQIRVKACIDLGGVPIMSGWTGDIKDCKFPPEPRRPR